MIQAAILSKVQQIITILAGDVTTNTDLLPAIKAQTDLIVAPASSSGLAGAAAWQTQPAVSAVGGNPSFGGQYATILMEGIPTWVINTAYVTNDVVIWGGAVYKCILANTGNIPPNATYWSVISVWSSVTAYVANDMVALGGVVYRCVSPNTNEQPPNASFWAMAAAAKIGRVFSLYTHMATSGATNLQITIDGHTPVTISDSGTNNYYLNLQSNFTHDTPGTTDPSTNPSLINISFKTSLLIQERGGSGGGNTVNVLYDLYE